MILITMQRQTNAFYIQSPRLQNTVPISVSENLAARTPPPPLEEEKQRGLTELLVSSP